MKASQIQFSKTSLLLFMLVFVSKMAISQTDTTAKAMQDTTIKAVQDSTKKVASTEESTKKKKKKATKLIAYGGITFNQLDMPDSYNTTVAPGWALGIAYKRGKFFYWQVGLRYNNAIYEVNSTGQTPIADSTFNVSDIDIPINVGINLLSITDRFLGLRIFVGAVPAFITSVGTSSYSNFTKDNANSFNFYGQAGVGVDILFLSIDAGYNFGTSDVFKNIQSKPGQAFVNLGFRF